MKRNRISPLLALCFLAALSLSASRAPGADAAITLPLQGHYRPGRYMPVRIVAQMASASDVFRLRAAGALTAEIRSSDGHIDALMPWLSIRAIHDVQYTTSAGEKAVALPLAALGEEERLIGFAGADPDALAGEFAGKSLVRVPLDMADPLPGDIRAWESLDGLVLDTTAARRLSELKLRSLLAGGTAVAIQTPVRPRGNPWIWKQHGACWVARVDIAGPTSAYVPQAYVPTQTWVRGWPRMLRREVLLAAIIFTILATAVTLWRGRWAGCVVIALSGVATGLALTWHARQSPAIEIGGSIIVLQSETTQRDTWTYRTVLREADGSIAADRLMRPVLGYRQQADDQRLAQRCAGDGRPVAIQYHLKPGQSLAFQSRSLTAGREALSGTNPVTSPLGSMADALYAKRGDRMAGEIRSGGVESWPDLVIECGGD